MSDPAAEVRALGRELRSLALGHVAELAESDVDFAASLGAQAAQAGHAQPHATLAARAVLLALAAAVRGELSGDGGVAALAAGGPAGLCAGRDFGLPEWRLLATMDTPCQVDGLTALIQTMRAGAPAEHLGFLYEELVAQSERRQRGQYWTPEPIARLMAAWAIRSPSDRVLDPAAGAGALVMPALARLEALGADPHQATRLVHTNDIDHVVAELLAANLAARSGGASTDARLEDALVGRDGDLYSAIVCNPPYTRHHHLDPDYKRDLRARVEAARGVHLSGFTSLYAFFYLLGLERLAPGGRAAFITPAELLDAAYARPIKKHLVESVNLRAVIFFGEQIDAFPGVDTAGTITLTEQGASDGADIAFVELTSWPGEQPILDALATGDEGVKDWGRVEWRSRAQLQGEGKWVVPAAARGHRRPGMVGLGDIARTMRGIATGNNGYFTLTETERRESGVEGRFLRPVVVKTRDWTATSAGSANLERLRDAGRKVWLFECRLPREELEGTAALEWIRMGEAAGVPEGRLISLRSVWYQLERRDPPDAFYTYLSRGWPRFIHNAVGAQNLNGFHSLYLDPELRGDPELLDATMAILNSDLVLSGLTSVGRSYGGGTVKVEPRELARLAVVDPRSLKADRITELAGLFRAGSDRGPAAFAPIRERIDALLR